MIAPTVCSVEKMKMIFFLLSSLFWLSKSTIVYKRKVPGLIHAARTGTATFLGREGKHNNRSSQSSELVQMFSFLYYCHLSNSDITFMKQH